jgi:hypothetical protein
LTIKLTQAVVFASEHLRARKHGDEQVSSPFH